MTENKKPLIILTGPTAVGKTSASIGLAKSLGCEIISADSMQVYKYMDIGSAKIMPDEMQGVPHYLVDELLPGDLYRGAQAGVRRSSYRLGIDGVHHHVHRRRTAFLHGNYGAVYCKDLHGGKAAPALYCCGEQPCRSDSD